MGLLGNVIFHAFAAPYVSGCFPLPLILLVLVVEGAALWVWNRSATAPALIGSVLGMNAASYAAGFLLIPWLFVGDGLAVAHPDETGHGILTLGPDWYRLAQWAFLQAWIASAIIEVLILLPFRRYAGLRRVVVPVVVGNTVSYAILYAEFILIFS